MTPPFKFTRTPMILFGPGKIGEAPKLLSRFGSRVLLVTGGKSFKASGRWDKLTTELKSRSIEYYHLSVSGEPTPELVDNAAAEFRSKNIRAVLAIGGGSVVDAGKAVSAMLTQDGSVVDFLEGVGTREHDGRKLPFMAAPTTSGTGSEATKNAVLSSVGPGGFKKSLRHDNFMPDAALIDPELMLPCPSGVTAACGMDAFTQLLESFVSTQASPMTDALALSGIEAVNRGLAPACLGSGGDMGARSDMAFGALMSGLTLANAGLGVVHGLAGPLGGFFPIPHGAACGALLGVATDITIRKLLEQGDPGHPALVKYAKVGAILSGRTPLDMADGCRMLVDKLHEWTESLKIPRLGGFGIKAEDLDRIIAAGGSKNNPVPLAPDEMKSLLLERL